MGSRYATIPKEGCLDTHRLKFIFKKTGKMARD